MSEEVKVTKEELFKSVRVSWLEGTGKYHCAATLRHGGYNIELPSVYHDNIDDAVKDIKERIIEALLKFKIPHEDLDM